MSLVDKVLSCISTSKKNPSANEIWNNLNSLGGSVSFVDVQDAITNLLKKGMVESRKNGTKNPRYRKADA